jgi:hypothetical protein
VLSGAAIARDRSDRSELTATQMTDRADARTAKMKVDLNLTADQEKKLGRIRQCHERHEQKAG